LASLAALGRRATERAEAADSSGVPEDARNVEAGFSSFVAKWEALGPAITQARFGRYLSGTIINCEVADSGRIYSLKFGPEGGIAMSAGRDPYAHAELVVDETDWIDILYGEVTGLAPALAGRTFAEKSEVNTGAIFAIVLYVFAHIPVSVASDPGFNAETVAGVLERGGGPSCGTGDGGGAPSVDAEDEVFGNNQAPDATRELARRVERITYDDLPPAVVDRVKEQIKNILAVSYAATELDPARRVVAAVEEFDGASEATAIAGDRTFRTSAQNAAMLNAYLAQMLEWEDFTGFAHTGSAIVPTALAAGELADASGKRLITAIALGNEIAGRTGAFLTDPTNLGQSLPVHQTELPFVAGKMSGLGTEELQDASGVAGVQPQLTAVPGWTADVKGMIGGEPAFTSVRAARLADAGVSGRRDHLENVGGYWYRVSDIADPQRLALAYSGLGDEWLLESEYYNKRYATNGFAQPAVHAALNVRDQLVEAGCDPTDPSTVESIAIRANVSMAGTGSLFSEGSREYIEEKVLDNGRPDWTYTPLLYDAVYPIAAALVEGELTHRQYTPETMADARIADLYEKAELATDVSTGDFGAEISVRVSEGALESATGTQVEPDREFSSFVGCIRGGVNADYSPSRKLRDAAGDTLSERKIQRLESAVDELETYDSATALTRRL
jgi:2-methylcitrate dehydratase PrpD